MDESFTSSNIIIKMLANYIMAIEYPSYNKMQDYITSTFEYANKYYSEIKRVYDVICSSESESDIRDTIIEICKEIYNSGGEKSDKWVYCYNASNK